MEIVATGGESTGVAEPDSIIAAGGRLGRMFSNVVLLLLRLDQKSTLDVSELDRTTYVAR